MSNLSAELLQQICYHYLLLSMVVTNIETVGGGIVEAVDTMVNGGVRVRHYLDYNSFNMISILNSVL